MKKILITIIMTLCTLMAYTVTAQAAETKEYTDKDIALIARVVYAEGRGESVEGKRAIAETVMNRYESGLFGKTLKHITRRSQFCKASVKTVSKKKNAAVYAECVEAVAYAITTRTLPSNTYYFQKANRKHWGGRKQIIRYCTIEKHTFYTLGEAVEVQDDICG